MSLPSTAYILISSIIMAKVVSQIQSDNSGRLETVNRTEIANTPRTYSWRTNNSRYYSTDPEFLSGIDVRSEDPVFSGGEFGCNDSNDLRHHDNSDSNCCCGNHVEDYGAGGNGGCCDEGGGCDSGGGYNGSGNDD